MLKLFKYLKPKDFLFILISVALIVAQVWLDLKSPDYMSTITTLIQNGANDIAAILEQGGYMLLCALGSLASAIVVGYLAATVSSNFSLTLREKIFAKVQRFSSAEIKKFQTNSLITRTTNDVVQMEMFIAMGLQMIVKAPILAVWAVTKILDKSLELSILTGVCVGILILTIAIILSIVLPRFKLVQKLIDKINGATREHLTGIRVIHAFNAEDFAAARFGRINSKLTTTQLFNQRTFAALMPMINLVMNGLALGIYFLGAILIDAAAATDKIAIFGNVVVFSSYGMQVIMAFLMLAMIFMILPRAQISAHRINEVLQEKITITDGTFSGTPSETGTLEFRHVSFKYPDAEEYLLRDVNLKVSQGDTVAFIGSTGSGKSTLVNLVPRFYDATDGEVFVDGVNVKEYQLGALRNKIGYISQRAFMFDGTVSSNVAYGDNGRRRPTKAAITQAIEIAQGKEFVEKLDGTYRAHIARGGTNVSGGQKQRLSIARAIARDPEIYIFDDSFSALDFKTDAALRRALKSHTKSATVLVVAQRIGTIINADKIVVLDQGKVAGIGTHRELLKTCRVYREIASSQLSKEELENA